MGECASKIGELCRFFTRGLRQFDRNAALFPSSRYLAEAMLERLPLERLGCVTELGPGSGAITRAILRRLPAGAHLHAVELDPEQHAQLQAGLRDPRLLATCGDAAELPAHLAAHGCARTQAVVSGLGLSLIPEPSRGALLRAASACLAPEGALTQFSYLFTRLAVYSAARQEWSRFHARRHLERCFGRVESRVELRNLWPAVVYTCSQPLLSPTSQDYSLPPAHPPHRRAGASHG